MRTRNRALAGLATAAVLLLTACGDDSGDDGVATLDDDRARASEDASSDMDADDALLTYNDCLRDHGVDMADEVEDGSVVVGDDEGVVVNGVEVDPLVWERAEEECRPHLDEAIGSFEVDPETQAQLLDDMTAVAACMRDRGYDVPDPQLDEGGTVTVEVTDDGTGADDPATGRGPDGPTDRYMEDWEDCENEAGMAPPPAGGGADG
jgi:hypothetical protein